MEYVKSVHVDRRIRQFLIICEKSTVVRYGNGGLDWKVIMMLFLGWRGHVFIQIVQLTVGDEQLFEILNMATVLLQSN